MTDGIGFRVILETFKIRRSTRYLTPKIIGHKMFTPLSCFLIHCTSSSVDLTLTDVVFKSPKTDFYV